jgi:hypothetical protein
MMIYIDDHNQEKKTLDDGNVFPDDFGNRLKPVYNQQIVPEYTLHETGEATTSFMRLKAGFRVYGSASVLTTVDMIHKASMLID